MAGYMNNGYGGYAPTPYYNPLQPQMDRLAQMQAQYQPTQQPQVPQTNQGILWVQGEAGAKSYLVAPNTSVLLMDSENERFYIKTTDSAGMPTLRTFEYKEAGVNAPEPQKQLGLSKGYLAPYIAGTRKNKKYICVYDNQQPSQTKSDNSSLEGSTTNE